MHHTLGDIRARMIYAKCDDEQRGDQDANGGVTAMKGDLRKQGEDSLGKMWKRGVAKGCGAMCYGDMNEGRRGHVRRVAVGWSAGRLRCANVCLK